MTVLIATAMLAWISVLFWLVNLPNPIEGFITSSRLANWCEIGAIAIFSLWCFIWLPFCRHEAQEKAHAEEKRGLKEKIQTLSNTKKNEEKAAFLKKSVKEIMANQLANLESRISEIANMDWRKYTDNLDKGEDTKTNELLDKISSFLKEFVSPDSAILFRSKTGVKYTQVVGQNFYQERLKYATTLDHLNHFAGQLKEIIKNH